MNSSETFFHATLWEDPKTDPGQSCIAHELVMLERQCQGFHHPMRASDEELAEASHSMPWIYIWPSSTATRYGITTCNRKHSTCLFCFSSQEIPSRFLYAQVCKRTQVMAMTTKPPCDRDPQQHRPDARTKTCLCVCTRP